MEKPERHILLCASFRTSGAPQGICEKKGSINLAGYLESELIDRGITGTLVSTTGCLKVCTRGPALVIYPDNTWYGKIDSEAAVDAILDAIEDGEEAKDYLIA